MTFWASHLIEKDAVFLSALKGLLGEAKEEQLSLREPQKAEAREGSGGDAVEEALRRGDGEGLSRKEEEEEAKLWRAGAWEARPAMVLIVCEPKVG